MAKSFEDLEVWKKSQDLAMLIYQNIDHRFQGFHC
jgi:hypothetical protein